MTLPTIFYPSQQLVIKLMLNLTTMAVVIVKLINQQAITLLASGQH